MRQARPGSEPQEDAEADGDEENVKRGFRGTPVDDLPEGDGGSPRLPGGEQRIPRHVYPEYPPVDVAKECIEYRTNQSKHFVLP